MSKFKKLFKIYCDSMLIKLWSHKMVYSYVWAMVVWLFLLPDKYLHLKSLQTYLSFFPKHTVKHFLRTP